MNEQAQKTMTNPGSLQNAVRKVLENNTALGYPSVRFKKATLEGSHPELLTVCEELIASPGALAAMERVVEKYRGFLTLEDYVMRWGPDWGFSPGTVDIALASADTFDRLLGFRRWVAESGAPVA